MMEKFEEIDPNDERVKNTKLALITANCSRSGVTNPVTFIVSEGEGILFSPGASITVTPKTLDPFRWPFPPTSFPSLSPSPVLSLPPLPLEVGTL